MQPQTVVSKLMAQGDLRQAERFNEAVRKKGYINDTIGPGVNMRQIGAQIPQDPVHLMQQNQNLRIMLQNIRAQRSAISNQSIIISNPEQPTMSAQIQQAVNLNNQRIIQLQNIARNQQIAIQQYQRSFHELQSNIQNLRILDSDIYKRLNEHDNTQLQNKVIEVKKALRSNAPYEILFAMLNDIKI